MSSSLFFKETLKKTLETRRSRLRGDHDLNGLRPCLSAARRAAVLVPILDRRREKRVLFIRRSSRLRVHSGQIGFPGGCVEPDDKTVRHAVLRESREEIGLDAANITLIGDLDPYLTRTGFYITPVVGLISLPLCLTPQPREVDEIFEAPLDFFLKPESVRIDSYLLEGTRRYFYAFCYPSRYIWGATAGILINLKERLQSSWYES